MHTRYTMRQTVVIGGVLGLGLVGCGGKTEISTCQLAGTNEVPPVTTTAAGEANATLDGSNLTVKGSFSGLQSDLYEVSGSAAHVHQGAIGVSGAIVFNLDITTTDHRSGTFTGIKSLSADEQKTFKAGGFYVNVHSQNSTMGEIRCQFDRVQ